MEQLTVAIVSRSEAVRLEAARAFDEAPPSWSVELHEQAPEGADVVVYGADIDVQEGIAFDPARPEDALRAVARARLGEPAGQRRTKGKRGSARTIVVTSASGGTGVTTVALHLAVCLTHKRSCYLDLDHRWGAAGRLGLSDGDFVAWDAADLTGDSIQRRALRVDAGFAALLSPCGDGDFDASALVAATAAQFERVIVDAPWSSSVPGALEVADAAVLVMPPTLSGALRARSSLDALRPRDVAVVVNRTGAGGETTRAQLKAALGRSFAIELPPSPALRDAEEEGRLLTSSWSRWSRRIGRLASALEAP